MWLTFKGAGADTWAPPRACDSVSSIQYVHVHVVSGMFIVASCKMQDARSKM